MEIKDTEIANNPRSLPPPRFDAAMISAAQQVEPLPPRGAVQTFLRGKLGMLIAIMVALLICAAAFGMVLGLRDRHNLIDETTKENQSTSDSTNSDEAAPTLKGPPPKVPARIQAADSHAPEPKPVTSAVPSSRSQQTHRAEADQDESLKSEKPVARKVGEIFGGRNRDLRPRRDDSRRREQANNNYDR
jgi:type IV secretory pathway VirB10-like protein